MGLLYLVGLPGVGKTNLGKRLAEATKHSFIDIDHIIEANKKNTIAQIFTTGGEEHFREIERQALHSTFNLENHIVATGGGLPCFFDNMEQILLHGNALFLDYPTDIIITRLLRKREKRPLLNHLSEQDLPDYIFNLRQKRIPYYSKSNLTITDPELNEQDIANLLIEQKLI